MGLTGFLPSGGGKACVVSIDTRKKTIQYFSNNGDNKGKLVHDMITYRAQNFDQEFYSFFIKTLQDFMKKYTPTQSASTTILLPDTMFFTETITMPLMKGNGTKNTLHATYTANFESTADLKIKEWVAFQNKLSQIICTVGIRNEYLNGLKSSLTAARLVAQNITFAAEATVHAVIANNSKLKNSTFLLMDIKDDFTRVVYIYKGVCVGFSSLPFGFEAVNKPKIAAEDMLFDRPAADLAVLNAREKAKAKSLTVMDEGNVDVSDAAESENGEEGEGSTLKEGATPTQQAENAFVKVLPKKTPRKLPKFMVRDVPETDEGIIDENFRIFVKWALCFLQGNEKLAALGAPEVVLVNMPAGYQHVLDAANAEIEQNGIKFEYAGLEGKDKLIASNLELYGGLFVGKSKSFNVF